MSDRATRAREVAAVRRRRCPRCGGDLTDPVRSPLGYSHCRACQIGWRIERSDLGEHVRGRPHDPPRLPPLQLGGLPPIPPGVRPDPRFRRPDEL